jgi:hypothetical protein
MIKAIKQQAERWREPRRIALKLSAREASALAEALQDAFDSGLLIVGDRDRRFLARLADKLARAARQEAQQLLGDGEPEVQP